MIELRGAPRLQEHVFIHRPSRTLIVADLIFNFRQDERGWNRLFHRYIGGFKRYPGMSRIFRLCISDRHAFHASLKQILESDFDRVIVGHGEVIESDGKVALGRPHRRKASLIRRFRSMSEKDRCVARPRPRWEKDLRFGQDEPPKVEDLPHRNPEDDREQDRKVIKRFHG